MNPIEIARVVEERYRRYLKMTFSSRDPDFAWPLRRGLDTNRLAKGPYSTRPRCSPEPRLPRSSPSCSAYGPTWASCRGARRSHAYCHQGTRDPQDQRRAQRRRRHWDWKRQDRGLLPHPKPICGASTIGAPGPGVRPGPASDERAGQRPARPARRGPAATRELGGGFPRAARIPLAVMFSYGQYIGATPESQPDATRRSGACSCRPGQITQGRPTSC
jgi:hypothetical protein